VYSIKDYTITTSEMKIVYIISAQYHICCKIARLPQMANIQRM